MNRWTAHAWSPARGRALYGARSQRAGLERRRPRPRPLAAASELGGREGGVGGEGAGLCRYTRVRCYSSLTFLVTIGILHIKEMGEGQCQKALV
jgi:hypothetical protein